MRIQTLISIIKIKVILLRSQNAWMVNGGVEKKGGRIDEEQNAKGYVVLGRTTYRLSGPVQEELVPDPDPFEEKHFHFYGSLQERERESVLCLESVRENSDGEARRESERVVVDSGDCGGLRLRETRGV